MKFPHWLVIALAVLSVALPEMMPSIPAKYAGLAAALLAVVAALKVQALPPKEESK